MSKVADIKEGAWKKLLVYRSTKDGDRLSPESGNAFVLLTNGLWRGRLAYDEFTDRMYWEKDGPDLDGFDIPRAGELVSDNHYLYIQHYMSALGHPDRVLFKTSALIEAVRGACYRNRKNSCADWLNSLEWDGVQRLPTWCVDVLGCEPSEYASSVGTWWMISAVARGLNPGCKADHVLQLEGGQGASKSSVVDVLGGEWYLAQLPPLSNVKDAYQVIKGKLIGELPELDSMRGAALSAVKAFMTVRVDTYRKSYGHTVETHPRTTVFVATTNEDFTLNDPTGARRWWPIKCGVINLQLLKDTRDQLFAEAVSRYKLGEQWWPTEAMAGKIQEEQEMRYAGDAWEGRVLSWADSQRDPFGLHDVLSMCLMMEPKEWNKSHETRIGAILARAGYQAKRRKVGDGHAELRRKVRLYDPRDPATEPPEFIND